MASYCCCCCCVLLIVFLSIAILVCCIALWLFTMGFELNLLSITVTSGFLIVLSLMSMVSTNFVVLIGGLWSLFLALYFWYPNQSFRPFCPENNFSRIFFGHFPKKSVLSINMNPLSTTAKTTLIYLSALTGVNLVLIMSSDPTTVVVGYACLILSVSSLASFVIDQAMLE